MSRQAKDDGVHRLVDMVVEEVSLVDRAANKHRFLVVKRETDMFDDDDDDDEPTEGVAKAGEGLRAEDPVARDLVEPRGQRQQMTGEIPAVDRGNIHRLQWLERTCVVPVVEVTAVTLQLVDRSQCQGRAIDEFQCRDVTKIVRSEVRGER